MEIHRYMVVSMISEAGGKIKYDPHGPEVVMAEHFDRVTAERDSLQLRLNAVEEENDRLRTCPPELEIAGYEGSSGLYYSRLAAVANGEQTVEPLYRVAK